MELKFQGGNEFIENGLTPAALIGKQISFSFTNENQLKSVFMLKKACPDYKHTQKVVLDSQLNSLHIDRFLTEIMRILDPREIEIQCKRKKSQIDMPTTTNMLYVHKLTVEDTQLQWILTKIQPIHTLRVIGRHVFRKH